MMLANRALTRFLKFPDVVSILDIGSGKGIQAQIMREAGKQVTTISLKEPADIIGDYIATTFPIPFDGIWASHVLEHMPNIGSFLEKCYSDLRPNGIFAVTVPPAKHEIVGGHLSLWNAGLLLYRLILAGFNCNRAKIKSYEYNISVIIRKSPIVLPPLDMDEGDIEKLAPFFPIPVKQAFNGKIKELNWD